VKHADDLVLLAKKRMVIQGMIERCYGLEMNVEKTKVIRISSQPSPVQIMRDEKQLNKVEYLIYLGSMKKLCKMYKGT
jgi:hypothetical protein